MRFVISVIDSATGSASAAEMAAIDAFNASLRVAGEFVLAVGLAHPDRSMVLDGRVDPPDESSGPLHVGDEYVSGMWMIDVADQATARERAVAGSRACNRRVELRAVLGD